MNTMNRAGFTAEASLTKNSTSYRMMAGGNYNDTPVVIPQLSCWRLCCDISSTNHELAECSMVCRQLKTIFQM